MKVSDYIVEYLISKGITDVFGYPGGMVTHLMDSFSKYDNKINAHVNYHEQASSFCACAYACVAQKPGVAYATSGPGATNLITGIANAYFDSIPSIFITGQVNINEGKGDLKVRQKGFQETDIISIVKSITKYSVKIDDKNKIKYYLEKAFYEATNGRPGPVLLDIPMNITREIINASELQGYEVKESNLNKNTSIDGIIKLLNEAKRPCFIIGSGVKLSNSIENLKELVDKFKIPVVTSMISIDTLSYDNEYNYGFLGAYGSRTANFIVDKSDLIISLGARLDIRQIGARKETFAPKAKLIRIDIDKNELDNKIKNDEVDINMNVSDFMKELCCINLKKDYTSWIKVCNQIKSKLSGLDDLLPNKFMKRISENVEDNIIITTDVGQNQVWVSQSFKFKNNQKCLFTGGHGAMGYSLPASIGAYYASKKKVLCITGDGGFQMNIQELQFIAREQLPITIVLFNNNSLGMIRHFQEMYFDNNYYQTTKGKGYTIPNFKNIVKAYNIEYKRIDTLEGIKENIMSDKPLFIELNVGDKTYVNPKLKFGNPNNDQDPLIDRDLYNYLNDL